MAKQGRGNSNNKQLSTTERELKDGRSRKSIYHWGARPLDFHPRGVQRPDAAARSNAAATWVRTYSGGWIDVAAQLDEAMALGLPWVCQRLKSAVRPSGPWRAPCAPLISRWPPRPRFFCCSKRELTPSDVCFSAAARGLAAPCGCFRDDGYYFAMAKSPSHALLARMSSCSRAKDPPHHLTGPPARTSHVATSALRSRSPNGLLNLVDWRCGRAALEGKGEVYNDVLIPQRPNLLHFDDQPVVPAHR
jgi:hypothetical protein